MSDTDSTLQVKTKAEIGDLIAYTKAVRDLAQAMTELDQAQSKASGSSGVGGTPPPAATGGAATGSPPPVPTPPPQAPGAGQPPAPPGSPPGPRQAVPAGQVPSRALTPALPAAGPGGAATGQPPPPPSAPVPATSGGPPRDARGRFLPRDGGGGVNKESWDISHPWLNTARQIGGGLYAAGDIGLSLAGAGMSAIGSGVGMGLRAVGGVASQALSFGMGSDLMSLPLTALNKYLQLSTTLTEIDRKFRDSSSSSRMFATSLGYTIERAAALSGALGRSTNTLDRGEGLAMTGLARFTGADPSGALTALGGISSRGGRRLGNRDMAAVLAAAKTAGMDQGRIDEFLQRLEMTSQQQFGATGATSLAGSLNVQGLQSVVYGAEDPRRSNDTTMLSGLNSVMTGAGPMRTYLMRAMGYGQKGGPGYIEMRERLDAGINDPRNVLDLFGSFQRQGMGHGAQFRALESVSGGQLKANQIDALVSTLGTPEGLARYQAMISKNKNASAADLLKGVLSPGDLKLFEGSGFAGLGTKGISAGESYQQHIESLQMKIGGELAKSIPDLMSTIDHLMGIFRDVFGGGFGDKIEHVAHAIDLLAGQVEAANKSNISGQSNAGWTAWRQQGGTWRDVVFAGEMALGTNQETPQQYMSRTHPSTLKDITWSPPYLPAPQGPLDPHAVRAGGGSR